MRVDGCSSRSENDAWYFWFLCTQKAFVFYYYYYFLEIKYKPDTQPPVITLRMCLQCNCRCGCSTCRYSTAVQRGHMAHLCWQHTRVQSPEGFPALAAPAFPGWLVSAHTWPAFQKLLSCLRWLLNKIPLKDTCWRSKIHKKEWEGAGTPGAPSSCLGAAFLCYTSSALCCPQPTLQSPASYFSHAFARRVYSLFLTTATNS